MRINKLILFQISLFVLLLIGSFAGLVSLLRVGQLFLGIGILDLVASAAALLGWPMLRGDVLDQARLSSRDSREVAAGGYSLDGDRPSTGFALRLALVGTGAIGAALVLILVLS
jgi:hypothetical protein